MGKVNVKLSQWARENNITYVTAYNWFKNNKLPVKAYQTKTGTIMVEPTSLNRKENVLIYCRVSNRERKDEMEYQVKRCEDYCLAKGYSISGIYKEIASGMNDKRKELTKMLNENPTIIVCENKDRLTRFGFNYLELLLDKQGCKIDVINRDNEDEKDLIKDMVAIMTSFCCRLYGARRGQNKSNKIKEIINDSND